MYVVFEKENGKVFDFKNDPTPFINNVRYSFAKVNDIVASRVLKLARTRNQYLYFNADELVFEYVDIPLTLEEKKEKAMALLQKYNVYLAEPLVSRYEESVISKLTEDLNLCADIIVATVNADDLIIPTIDYI